MKKYFPHMLDYPEKSAIISAGFYVVIAFYSLPFIMFLLMQGGFGNKQITSTIEIAYHVINFLLALAIYWRYLVDAWQGFYVEKKVFFGTVAAAVGMMLAYTLYLHFVFTPAVEYIVGIAGFGALPLTEMELFTLSSNLIDMNPLWGTLCLVLLAPFSTVLLYYATAFAPATCHKPWLGYVVVTLLLAFPRFCNAMTFWLPEEELVLYLAQLPLHLIACWTYQRTDSVWTPILTLGIANLLSSLPYLALTLFF